MHLEYFQMIDEVVTVNVEEASIMARSRVPRQSTVFEGHFPDLPLMPGVLLIETMAQASGYLIMALNDFSALPLLASVGRAKLRAPVAPGTELIVMARVEHDGSGFAVMEAKMRQDGAVISDAMLTMKLIDFPSESLRRHLLVRVESAGLLALES